jgi:hypothetical protein
MSPALDLFYDAQPLIDETPSTATIVVVRDNDIDSAVGAALREHAYNAWMLSFLKSYLVS